MTLLRTGTLSPIPKASFLPFNKHKVRRPQLTWVYTMSYRDCIILHSSLLHTFWKVFLSEEHFLPGQWFLKGMYESGRAQLPSQSSWETKPALQPASFQGRGFRPLRGLPSDADSKGAWFTCQATASFPSHQFRKTLLVCCF